MRCRLGKSFSSREFRDGLGLFATGVAVATATHGVERAGITVNSFASVSLEPPLVLFSASKSLRSSGIFERARGFAINVLSEKQRHLSSRFARAGEDKWDGVATRPGLHGGVVIPRSLVSFDCLLHCRYEGGDHTILVGEVVGIDASGIRDPLIYFSSSYHQLTSSGASSSAV